MNTREQFHYFFKVLEDVRASKDLAAKIIGSHSGPVVVQDPDDPDSETITLVKRNGKVAIEVADKDGWGISVLIDP